MSKVIKADEIMAGDVVQRSPGEGYVKVMYILPDHLHNGWELRCKNAAQENKTISINATYGHILLIHRPELVCAKCQAGEHCAEDDNKTCACCWKVV